MNLLNVVQYLSTVMASESLAKPNTRHAYDKFDNFVPYVLKNLLGTRPVCNDNHFESIINLDA